GRREVNMRVPDSSSASRVKGSLRLSGVLALCCALLAVAALARQLCRPRPDGRLGARGRTVTGFLQHLRNSGIQLHVVPTAEHGPLAQGAYLTEDADATWGDMQSKRRIVEYIHQWRGTVWL